MIVVVPAVEGRAEGSGVLDRTEGGGKSGRYFRVLNWASENGLSLLQCGREWDLVTTRSASRNATGFRRHRAASVGVDGHLVPVDVLLRDRVAQQPFGQLLGLTGGDHPADGVAGVDVDDRVQVVVGPLRRPGQLGEVLRPALVWSVGEELGLDPWRVVA
jgi:hypothetical protein